MATNADQREHASEPRIVAVINPPEDESFHLDLPDDLEKRSYRLKDEAPPESEIYTAELALLFIDDADFGPKQSRCIAGLRDFCTGSVLCALPLPADQAERSKADTEMRALGFRVEQHPLRGLESYRCYAFNIRDYKHTPDWLNPRAWANPELWGKYRW